MLPRAALVLFAIAVLAGCERSTVDHQALRGIVGEQPVVLLSAAWCGYCTKLRGDLTAMKVPFRELDVETSAAGEQAYDLIQARGVPVLLVGRDVQRGYAPEATRRSLEHYGLLPKS